MDRYRAAAAGMAFVMLGIEGIDWHVEGELIDPEVVSIPYAASIVTGGIVTTTTSAAQIVHMGTFAGIAGAPLDHGTGLTSDAFANWLASQTDVGHSGP